VTAERTQIMPEGLVKKPCNECPWRRNALAGYLGPHNADEWLSLAETDAPIACHKTIQESESFEGTKHCAGAATYRANRCKLPRDKRIPTGPSDHDGVFSNPVQFKDHHNAS